MADLMGFPSAMADKFKGLFSGFQDNGALDAEPAIGGGSGTTQISPTAMQNYLDDSQIFNRYTVSDLEQAQAAGLTDTNRVEVLSPTEWNNRFNPIPDMLKAGNMNPFNIFYGPEQGGVEQTYVAQDTGGSFEISDIPPVTPVSMFGIGKDNFVPETRYGLNNSRQLVESNLLGFLKPTPAENFYAQRRFDAMRQERELQAAMAESKRAAEEYEAQQAAERARIEAEKEAAAERERQAAAQRRKNDNYETGYVAPNRYTTKDVNNSFAARRDIRNIFA
jgi:hypothetical protein